MHAIRASARYSRAIHAIAELLDRLKIDAMFVGGVARSAWMDAEVDAGAVHLGLVNIDPTKPVTVSVKLQGVTANAVSGRVLTGPAMNSANTFEAPNVVHPVDFTGARVQGDTLTATLPAHSVVVLSLK